MGVCVPCAGRHRVALLLALHPAVDRSQRQGALQRSGVEDAAAAGGGAFCSAHPATHAQVSGTIKAGQWIRPTFLKSVLRSSLLAVNNGRSFRQMSVTLASGEATQNES